MTTSTPKRLWKNEYFQTVIMIVLIVSAVFVFWFGLKSALNTDYPMLAVASGSMSLPRGTVDDGWSHPFDPTLHTGDLIIVQGVNTSEIHAAPYPNGDILVFRSLYGDDLIVHRAIEKTTLDGKLAFVTQGDANSYPGPSSPTPADHVIGKVVFRIPWIGHLALLMRDNSGVYVVLALIIIVIIVELALPMLSRSKKTGTRQEETSNKSSET